jgi:ABC-type transport system involved in multi-copper enzyme maturation permease subunit
MPLVTIARNGFLESIRQPVYVVVVLAGILALVLNVNLAAFSLGQDDKLLVDLGLSTLFIAGLLLAAFTASGVLAREIENRTVLTVVSKPVPRWAVVVGKYLGVCAAIGLAYWVLSAVFLLAVRHRVQFGVGSGEVFDGPVLTFGLLAGGLALAVAGLLNYLYRRPFPSTLAACLGVAFTLALGIVSVVDRDWYFQDPRTDVNPQLLIGLAMVLEAILVLSAVAIAASTRLGQVLTLLVCVGAFLMGLVSEYFLGGSLAADAAPLERALLPVYLAVPNLQFFWPADALTQGHAISGRYFASVTLYGACMVAALLSGAVILFQRRDVG